MRNETTVVRRPKTWVSIVLVLGHLAIIAGLVVSALSPRREALPLPDVRVPSIFECAEAPLQLR